jgi:hypothetical protein
MRSLLHFLVLVVGITMPIVRFLMRCVRITVLLMGLLMRCMTLFVCVIMTIGSDADQGPGSQDAAAHKQAY